MHACFSAHSHAHTRKDGAKQAHCCSAYQHAFLKAHKGGAKQAHACFSAHRRPYWLARWGKANTCLFVH
eukprot:1136123-Pelagomonas_calceolata.AAC.7